MSSSGTARLLSIGEAAKYLGGISPWTLRGLVAGKHVKPVRLPSVRHPGEQGRRLLFDVNDLNALVEKWKALS
jgi:hypothetical protein